MTDARGVPVIGECAPSAIQAVDTEAASMIAAALKSIADPLRLRMISAIATDPRGESCVCDLADLADVSQPTVSHHLKVLKETGILESERRGTWVWYRITPARRDAVTVLLDVFSPTATLDVIEGMTTPAVSDEHVTMLAEELAKEFPHLDRDLIVMIARESYVGLARSAKAGRHLMPRTRRFTHQRLVDLTRDRATAPPQVLFVCIANAGRSQLAAALVNRLSGGTVVARSAGSKPAPDVHPHVRPILTKIEGTQADNAFPKPLTDDAVRAADVVVTMGCGDVCPMIPGTRYEDWAVGDPVLAGPAGIEAICDDIEARVRDLLSNLIPTEQGTPRDQ